MSAVPVAVSVEEVSRFPFPMPRGAPAMELPQVVPASRLVDHPVPPTVLTGIEQLDALTGGLPRGALSEICGPASSGRTSVLLALVAAMTRREEVCALVDVNDSFDPHSAEAAGVDLRRLLWVRCSKNRVIGRSGDRVTKDGKNDQWPGGSGRRKPQITNPSMSLLDQALKATDLLLQGGGFGLVVVDLGDVSPQAARRIPLTSWFRFRRAVERTPTVLLVVEQEPYAKTCASAVLRLVGRLQASGARLQQGQEPSHARLFSALEITAEVVRSAAQGKKPVRAEGASFASRALWTG